MNTITAEEQLLLQMPLAELLQKGLLRAAIVVRDKKEAIRRQENLKFQSSQAKVPFIISDSLGKNVNGVLNHADGKRYDSKSAYEKAVRAKGCRIVGNDYNNVNYKTPMERGIAGDFNVKPQLKEAVQKVLQ